MMFDKESPFWKRTVMAEDKDIKVIPLPQESSESTPSEAPSNAKSEADKSDNFPAMAEWRRKSCAQVCLEIWYVVLGIVTMIFCVASIIVTISSSVANKLYDAEQSGHLVVMLVLAGLSAVTMSVIIYSILGICRTDVKSLYATGFLLFILAIIQALLTGLVVNVNDADHRIVGKSLIVSFNQSQAGSYKHMKLWAQTQYELQCCGVYGAEDYRPYNIPSLFPPDVPISCCPTYDADFPEHAQERARELCKANKDFYWRGCKPAVEQIFHQTALIVVIVTSILIVFEVLLGISAAFISKRNEARLRNKIRKL